MCFEMGALCVSFAAANVVARVSGDPLPRPGAPAAFRLRFLRQAVPTGDHEGLCAAHGERKFMGYFIRKIRTGVVRQSLQVLKHVTLCGEFQIVPEC